MTLGRRLIYQQSNGKGKPWCTESTALKGNPRTWQRGEGGGRVVERFFEWWDVLVDMGIYVHRF